MNDGPITLDSRRKPNEQEAIEVRRRLREKQGYARETYDLQRLELEEIISLPKADTFPEFAVKVRFLIKLYSETRSLKGPLEEALIRTLNEDLNRLEELQSDSLSDSQSD